MVELELFGGRELNLSAKEKILGKWNRIEKVMDVLPGVNANSRAAGFKFALGERVLLVLLRREQRDVEAGEMM